MNWIIAAAAAASVLIVGLAAAQSPAPPPDANLSRLSACVACHGVDGVSVFPPAPNLAGQRANYIETQLRAFRAKERKDDLMNAIAAQLSDAEIAALARHWNSLPAAGTLDDAARRAGAVRSLVTFPRDFPSGFEIYRTSEDAGSNTIARGWANRAAIAAARAGRALPLDAVIVTETLSAKHENGRLSPGAPTSYAVFAANAGWGSGIPDLLRNGDWQFGLFRADREPRLANQAMCLACHKPQAEKSFMFTYDELAAHARK